ncbi:DUF4369 domain-containing protein [Emticicia agri]|uniref:DUF4369 domain-containing protein n=1 Tax=Emticicia agri TaxID=2492393 RepID=A0A4V1ZCQ0_9BACT|nr:DUF4369 domain-containing protein [Emticicia agri]RYU93430.1 DUF4369 domain-containing protein [Emticicia agri]
MNIIKLITLLCFSFPAIAQLNFQVKGKINGAENQTVLLITSAQDTLASTQITGGKFRIKSSIGEPQLCYFQDSKKKFRLPVLLKVAIHL